MITIKQEDLLDIRNKLLLSQAKMATICGMRKRNYQNYEWFDRILSDKVAYAMTKRLEDYLAKSLPTDPILR